MIWLAILFGVLWAFVMGTWFGKEKMVGAALACWVGGSFYAGYMICLAINY